VKKGACCPACACMGCICNVHTENKVRETAVLHTQTLVTPQCEQTHCVFSITVLIRIHIAMVRPPKKSIPPREQERVAGSRSPSF